MNSNVKHRHILRHQSVKFQRLMGIYLFTLYESEHNNVALYRNRVKLALKLLHI